MPSAQYENMTPARPSGFSPMMEEVLVEARLGWSDLDALGVGIGPGNFTGIRISVSAARGLALSLGIPAVGVNLFDALAEEAQLPALLCLEAPRNLFHVQLREAERTGEIMTVGLNDLPACPPGTRAIGTGSDGVAEAAQALRAPAIYAPASAIARIAARRYLTETGRPAPLLYPPARRRARLGAAGQNSPVTFAALARLHARAMTVPRPLECG